MEQETQKLSAWDRQLLIRDKNRPTVRDYIPRILRTSMNCTATVASATTAHSSAVSAG